MTAVGKGLETAARHVRSIDAAPVQILLNATSPAQVDAAVALLRQHLSEDELVRLVNLREVLSDVPTPPFTAGTELDVLGRVLDYEHTGRSWRSLVDSPRGVCGIEFIGDGNAVAGVVLHTLEGRVVLHGAADSLVSPAALDVLTRYEELAEALMDALREIGMPLAPLFYLSMDDFLAEHAADASAEHAPRIRTRA